MNDLQNPIFRPKFAAAVAGCVLVLAANGCSQSEQTDPKPPARIAEHSAQPLPKQDRSAESPRPTTPEDHQAVRQVANVEAVPPAAKEASEPATLPEVLLTKQHAALCRIKVGENMPAIELAKLDGGKTKLADLFGKAATVVVFWKGDRSMAQEELADLGPDVVEALGPKGVAVVGIDVQDSDSAAQETLKKSSANFANLLDADGKAFAKVGAQKLPWTLVLDANGKIVWFDLEYSHATRRELQQALLATIK